MAQPVPNWQIGCLIAASIAALLGTSDDPPPRYFAAYEFSRSGIEGGRIDLTASDPSARFLVTVRAVGLGPDQVVTTDSANATVDARLTISQLPDGQSAPFTSVRIGTPDGAASKEGLALVQYVGTSELLFQGDCESPTSGTGCQAQFSVELRRSDDGTHGGVVRVEWSLTVGSKVLVPAEKNSSEGPIDPPWSIEVLQQ